MFAKRFAALSLAAVTTVAAVSFAQNQPSAPPARDPRGGDAQQPAERRPDVMGRVTTVSPDGKTLTLTAPPRPAGDGQPPARDAQPETTTVTLTDATQLVFFGVSDGQAQIAPGLMAMVWYETGSAGRAARVRLMKREGEDRPDVQGRVLAVSPDGRTVTVELRDRDQVTGKAELHMAPYTQTLYYNVDRDGARPTPDYQVVAWLEKGSKDVPARVRFMKPDRDAPGGR